MAEFIGTDEQTAIQKRLFERQVWIKDAPDISNGGRVLNFLDVETTGWDRIIALTHQDGIAGFTAVDLKTMTETLVTKFGPDWKMPHWDVFLGDAQAVLAASRAAIKSSPLPDGWRIETLATPSDTQIDEIQQVNMANGVAPSPAYYLRGDIFPHFSTCIWNDEGIMVATSAASARYHPEGRFAEHLFEGSVAVSAACRGMGLGRRVNAQVLVDSYDMIAWKTALAQVQPDNAPSRAMIDACGLDNRDGLVTIAVNKLKGTFTR